LKNPWSVPALAIVAALLLTIVQPAQAAGVMRAPVTMPQSFADASHASAAAGYCQSTGGIVDHRKPVFGTNDPPAQQLVLSGTADFCRYTHGKGQTSSSIYVLLTTLVATLPTLAALAYYAKVPEQTSGCSGNPSSCYCTYLGGSDQFGGANLAGGAWVLDSVSPNSPYRTLQACIFPDLSSIDSWGLLYHSVGTIRGIDLSKVLKYQKKH
jgi:putative hemolysin